MVDAVVDNVLGIRFLDGGGGNPALRLSLLRLIVCLCR